MYVRSTNRLSSRQADNLADMLAYVSRECPRESSPSPEQVRGLNGNRRSDRARVVLGFPHVFKTTRTRVIHVRWITGTEERSESLIGCEQTAATESTVFATNVSGRVKTPDRIPRHSSVSYRSLPLFLSPFFFHLMSSIPLPSGFFPPFEILALVRFRV